MWKGREKIEKKGQEQIGTAVSGPKIWDGKNVRGVSPGFVKPQTQLPAIFPSHYAQIGAHAPCHSLNILHFHILLRLKSHPTPYFLL